MSAIPQLRTYQQTLADLVRDAFRAKYRCAIVVAATGAGKTILFSYTAYCAASRGNPVLIAAHRKEIIRQISLSLALFGVEHQVIAPPGTVRKIQAAHFRKFRRSYVKATATTMVGSVQTIVGRFDHIDAVLDAVKKRSGDQASKLKPLIIMDEAHHVVVGNIWGRVMDRYHVELGWLGLLVTASPERMDGTGLGAGFGGYADIMIKGPEPLWLIQNGFLSPYEIYGSEHPIDMTGSRKRMGEWVQSDAEERANKPVITGDAIEEWKKHAQGMRTVAFCTSIKHSKDVAAAFCAAGIPAAHIDGDIEDDDRDQAIEDFAAGKILVLTNVNLVSEGFDLASIAQADVTIDCMLDISPTESLVTVMQRWGRALRPAPGKVAVILDLAANVGRMVNGEFERKHGLPDDVREWSLEGRKKGGAGAVQGDEMPPENVLRECLGCRAKFRHAKAVAAGRERSEQQHVPFSPCCPVCGKDMPVKNREVKQVEGEAVKIDLEANRVLEATQAKRAQGKAQTVEEMVATLGYSRGRAEKVLKARQDKEALQAECRTGLAAWAANNPGRSVKDAFGVFVADVRMMKPKELRDLLEKIGAANDNGFSVKSVLQA